MDLSVVVPVFNEAGNIDSLLDEIRSALNGRFEYEVVYVDDGSGDGELADLDEISTKLDLARAYIDMGDPDGARSILDEVLQEGNSEQKDEAQDIMQMIA